MFFAPKSASLSLLLSTFCLSVSAAQVELAGVFGKRVVLIVNGTAPQTLAVGQASREGVKVLEVGTDGALVAVSGSRIRVGLGDGPIRLAPDNTVEGEAARLRLHPDPQGHYWAQGAVNGAAIRLMVDTGATFVAIGADDARRAGIDYRAGRRVTMNTANGPATAYVVMLDRISVGGITLYGVEASVHEKGLPVALLGMSFMKRVGMQRDDDVLVLHKRF